MVCPPPSCGSVVGVDGPECWLMESYSVQVVLSSMVFATDLAKCGKKGKCSRQAALHSLIIGRCAGAQGLGGPYHGGEVNIGHESLCIYRIHIICISDVVHLSIDSH